MYREPRKSIMDRHTLIELDGDFTDYEMGHLLRKAYQNHKAPHEYDDIKKYIRDIVIGKHNSLYITYTGYPMSLSAASVLMPSNTLNWTPQGQTFVYDDISSCAFYAPTSGCINTPTPCGQGTLMITYNNGTAAGWIPLYTTSSIATWSNCNSGSCQPIPYNDLVVTPNNSAISANMCSSIQTIITPKYLYAAYITSTNPLTLSTYHYWTLPTTASTQSYNYVYFLYLTTNQGGHVVWVPLFYSTGSFTFNPGVTYITMWQWTYT